MFEHFLRYFFPPWAEQHADFSQPFEFLDKELDAISTDKENQKRYADKLVKVFLKDSTEQWILVHVEVQGYQDEAFAERMFIYFYRILDRFGKKVMAIALLTDDNPNYLPTQYVYQFQETKHLYQFPVFKLLHKTEKELNVPNNPFSIVMLTARKALEQKEWKDEQQFLWKRDLVFTLKAANYDTPYIRKILNFIKFYVHFGNNTTLRKLDTIIQETFHQRRPMGIEEAILAEVTQKVTKQVTEQVTEQVTQKVTQQVTQQNKIAGIKKALQRGKLTLEEIAEDFEVTLDFVLQVQRGEIK